MNRKELDQRFKHVRIREDVLKELKKLSKNGESVSSVLARLIGIDYEDGLLKRGKKNELSRY